MEVLGKILTNPFVDAIAMGFASLGILDFWVSKLHYRRRIHAGFIFLVAAINGIMSFFSAVYTDNSASPRTIALFIPIMITLEILIFGHMGLWGTLFIFVLSSFQYITLFSVAAGLTATIASPEFITSRSGLTAPVTAMNIFFIIFMASFKLYRSNRDEELRTVIMSPRISGALFIYTAINAIAITALTYPAIEGTFNPELWDTHTSTISASMIIRDTILFFSTVLMLDSLTRYLKSKNDASTIAAKNIMLEKDRQLQDYIAQGIEAQRKMLEEQNISLASDIEREKALRKKLHRNILSRITANLSTNIITESSALSIYSGPDNPVFKYDETARALVDTCVHPDFREDVFNAVSIENLLAAARAELSVDISFKLSPSEYIKQFSLDDDGARLYLYMDRDYIWTSLECSLVEESNGDVFAYIYIMDVDEKKQQEEATKKAATTDSLTGLYNRRAFQHYLDEYLSSKNKGGSLFMFDLDHFKNVNDTLGHPKGDELLIEVASILSGTFRSNDILCRIGGDEFCAFAKGFTDKKLIEERASALIERGRMSFDTPSGEVIHVSFSIGVAVIPGDADNSTDLYKAADSALYRAKKEGRDCHRLASS